MTFADVYVPDGAVALGLVAIAACTVSFLLLLALTVRIVLDDREERRHEAAVRRAQRLGNGTGHPRRRPPLPVGGFTAENVRALNDWAVSDRDERAARDATAPHQPHVENVVYLYDRPQCGAGDAA